MASITSEAKVPYSKVKKLADRPYAFTLRPVEDGYEITFPELPGCVTQVDSLDDVNTKIRQVKRTWITALLESGYQIPEPRDNVEFSGRILLRCSSALHRALVEMAALEGTSLNQLLVQASSQLLGFKQAKSMAKSVAEEMAEAFGRMKKHAQSFYARENMEVDFTCFVEKSPYDLEGGPH